MFVGAGTTGTLMGCARWFREWSRPVKVVAVDSVGSVTFGGAPGRRMIPGLGMSVHPPLLDESFVDEVVLVEEADTIRACHRLARRGFLFGGSTGTVVSGAMSWLEKNGAPGLTSVAIAPDLGERYLDTIYQSNWLQDLYGEDVLEPDERADTSWADPAWAAAAEAAWANAPAAPRRTRARTRTGEDAVGLTRRSTALTAGRRRRPVDRVLLRRSPTAAAARSASGRVPQEAFGPPALSSSAARK